MVVPAMPSAPAHRASPAEGLISEAEGKLRNVLSSQIWGRDSGTLEGVVGALLTGEQLTLATMESCTGGLPAVTVSDFPGSSAYFKGGFVAYTNEMKTSLGVDARLIEKHGSVSREVAEAMAQAAGRQFKVDIGVAVTSVAGPYALGGRPPGPAYIGIADKEKVHSVEGQHPPRRVDVKRLVVTHALFILGQELASR